MVLLIPTAGQLVRRSFQILGPDYSIIPFCHTTLFKLHFHAELEFGLKRCSLLLDVRRYKPCFLK